MERRPVLAQPRGLILRVPERSAARLTGYGGCLMNEGHTAIEIILELGVEGGAVTLLGSKAGGGWRFCRVTDERTMHGLLGEHDRPPDFREEDWVRCSHWVDSWESALALLGGHWPLLFPLQVHPEFGERVWAAVQDRVLVRNQDDLLALERWCARCSGARPSWSPRSDLMDDDPDGGRGRPDLGCRAAIRRQPARAWEAGHRG